MNPVPMPEVLATDLPGVELRPLDEADAEALHAAIAADPEHLTRFGDYGDLVSSTVDDLAASLRAPSLDKIQMGIWLEGELAGQVDLTAPAPRQCGLGYWVSGRHARKGLASAACRALMNYAESAADVEAFWAGVREANVPSRAMLERLGFSVHEILPTHVRYRRAASGRSEPGA